jgi:hypothetical protein
MVVTLKRVSCSCHWPDWLGADEVGGGCVVNGAAQSFLGNHVRISFSPSRLLRFFTHSHFDKATA